jgi:outer membrane protein assembly factor BamB
MSNAFTSHPTGRRWPWVAGLLLCAVWTVPAADWPQYRGPNHDGVSTDRLLQTWSGTVTNPIWLRSVTNSVSSLTVSGGRVFTQIRRAIGGSDKEVCVALEAGTGQELWAATVDDQAVYDGGVGYDDGPRTTPVVDGDSVYVLSSYLNLHRLNATNGAPIWHLDLRALYGGEVIPWQNAASPLIDGGLIFLNVNAGQSNLMALRASDGSLVWRSQDAALTHASPVLATIHGARQLIYATQGGLVSVDPPTGDLLWSFAYPFNYTISLAASPVVDGDIVFISGFYNMGAVAARIVSSNQTLVATQLWKSATLQSHWMTPVCSQGHLFGQFTPNVAFDNTSAPLKCIDLETGAEAWSTNNFGRGSTLLVDGRLLVLTERGDLVLAEANTNAYTELGRFRAIPNYHSDTNKCWNAPAVSGGRVYIRSTSYGAAYDLSPPASKLQLDPPQPEPGNTVHLTFGAADGAALDSNRLAGLELRAATNVALPRAQWTRLTNTFFLSNGVAHATGIQAAPPRFFIVNEPQ